MGASITLLALLLASQPTDPQRAQEGPVFTPTPGEHADRWIKGFEDPNRSTWQKPAEVIAALRIQAGDIVADIGAGKGYFTFPFSRAVGKTGLVYAVDVERDIISRLQNRLRTEGATKVVPVLGRPGDPKLPGKVDLVFICGPWHHVENRMRYLRTLAGSLKSGGRLAIIDFRKKKLPIGPGVETKLRADEVIDEATTAGFRLVEQLEFLPHQYFLIFQLSEK